ncbi:RHS repeat-associated protein, partial [Dokdonella fugitiva]
RYARDDAGGRRYFLTDHLGSTTALSDSGGNVTVRYSYSPYGDTSMTVLQGAAPTNSYQYTGRENDGAGLYYYRARYYSPGMGRFTQADPLGFIDGPDVYAYVGGRPLQSSDPMGLWAWGDPLPQGMVDFFAGWGDVVSFGLTNQVRSFMGWNDVVNRCSGAYKGGEAFGFANDLAIGWAAGARSAVKGYAEFSHSAFPNRYLKQFGNGFSRWLNSRGNRLNGDFMPWERHASIDPWAYRFASQAWKEANDIFPAWRQALNRIPYFPGAMAYGAGSAMINGDKCGCSN